MTEQARAALQRGVPWRRGMAWWIVGIEGVILTAIGIYVIADPDTAQDIVRQLIGAFLLINSGAWALAGLRTENQATPITPYRLLAAGVGLTSGLLVFLEPVSDLIDGDAAKVILAVGLLGCGLIILAGAFATRAAGGLRRGPLIAAALYIVFALMLLFNARRDTLDPRWFGYAAVACGVLVCGYAFALYRNARLSVAADGAVAGPADTVLSPAAPEGSGARAAAPSAPTDAVIPPADDSMAHADG